MNNQNNNGNKKKKYYQHYNNHYNNKNKNKKNKKFYYYQNQHKKHNNYQQYKKNDNNINNNYQNEIKEDIVDDREYLERDNDKKLEENFFEDINHDDFEDNEYLEKQDFLKKKEEQEEIKLDDLILEETIGLDVNKIEKQKEFSKSNANQIEVDDYQEDVKVKPDRKFSLVIYIIGTILVLAVLSAVSYAWFNYYQEGSHEALAEAGTIYVKLDGNTRTLSLSKLYPTQTDTARAKNDNYVDFTILGMNTSPTKDVFYNITVSNGDAVSGKTRINPQYLLFDLSTLDASNNETRLLSAVTFNELNNASLDDLKVAANTTEEISQKYRIRMWIKGDLLISDTETGAAYTQNEFNNLYASIKVEVSTDIKEKETGSEKVLAAITEHATGTCQNITYDEDGVTYLSGTNDCINFNYVWYSGKLWRITAIYDDGAMKLITENNITSIAFNEDASSDATKVNFYNSASDTSYMYQWLNEDFYDTLYQPEKFIDTTKRWNATMPANTTIITKPAETNMVDANVGLLNSYEYYNSYRCIGSTACTGSTYSTGYLNIGYFWWLLNPYSASDVWFVLSYGAGHDSNPSIPRGGRPSIYLKSGLEFTGSGTKVSPYKIMGDKDTGSANDLINTRLSGEYVKLVNNDSNQMFRIIGVEDNKTKIIAMDYANNKGTRKFATSTGTDGTLWGSGTTLDTDTWYEYLNRVDNSDISNTGYYDKLVKTYGELFTSGTYYLGTSGYNYKLSVCANTTSGNTKVCDKTSVIGTFNIGLPRYGEMFATQQGTGYSNSIDMWLMNRYYTSNVWFVDNYGDGIDNYPASSYGGRPTLHLKSSVKIISGTGTESNPYVVGL